LYPYSYVNEDLDSNPCTTVTWSLSVRQGKKALGSALVADGTDFAGSLFNNIRNYDLNSVIGYVNFTVNESDVNRIGFTDFHLSPGWNTQDGCIKTVDIYSTEALGQSTDPYLNVTYELPVPNVTLISPLDNNITTLDTQTFMCAVNQSWIPNGEVWINNISFFTNHSTSYKLNQTIDLTKNYNFSNGTYGMTWYHPFDNKTSYNGDNPISLIHAYFTEGKVNNALTLNDTRGVNSTVATARYNATSPNKKMYINNSYGTIAFWMKNKFRITTLGEDRHDLFHYYPLGPAVAGNGSIDIFKTANSNTIFFYVYPINGTVLVGGRGILVSSDLSAKILPETWHFYAFTWNITTPIPSTTQRMEIWRDGVLDASAYTWTQNWTIMPASNGSMYIGTDTSAGRESEALIDEFAIFNRPLNASEINLLMAQSNYTQNYTAQFSMRLK